MLDLMYLTIIKLTAVMAMTMFLMRTEMMKEAMTFAMMPTMLASLVMVTMVMATTVMALLTIFVATTAMMLVTHLTVVMLSVKEKRKRKQYSNLREEVTTIVDLMDLTIMKNKSGDGNDNVLGGNRKKEGGKDVCNDDNVVGKTCDGDNGDGDISDGIVNNFGGIDSNDVVNPPDSGDAVGEDNSVSDANNVGKSCDGDNGDGDNSDGIVNNIGGNDSNYVGSPPDSDDAVSERKKERGNSTAI
jgi:hypothetical protein